MFVETGAEKQIMMCCWVTGFELCHRLISSDITARLWPANTLDNPMTHSTWLCLPNMLISLMRRGQAGFGMGGLLNWKSDPWSLLCCATGLSVLHSCPWAGLQWWLDAAESGHCTRHASEDSRSSAGLLHGHRHQPFKLPYLLQQSQCLLLSEEISSRREGPHARFAIYLLKSSTCFFFLFTVCGCFSSLRECSFQWKVAISK